MLAAGGGRASMRRVDGRPLLDLRTRAALLALGFASGLPAELLGGTFQTMLADAGLKAKEIGILALVTLPAALKPLWAPLVDRWDSGLGRRRGWMALALVMLAPALGVLGLFDPRAQLGVLIAVAAAAAIAAATLDLAVNGYTCDAVDERSAAAGAGMTVWGWRAAALVSSLGALALAKRAGWEWAYAAMGLAAVLCLAPVLLAREPRARGAPATIGDALVVPLRAFWRELGPARLVAVLAFALLFRLADSWAGNQTGVFLPACGFDKDLMGLARGPVALVAAGLGVLAAGWAGVRLAAGPCLLIAGLLGAGSNLAFVALDRGLLAGSPGLMTTLAIEAGCGGFMSAVFVGFLMRLCTSSCAATQYALLTAVWLLGRYLTAPAGAIVEAQGWTPFFLWSAAAGLPGLLLIPVVARDQRPVTGDQRPATSDQ